jgi:rod shape determining protein RodA
MTFDYRFLRYFDWLNFFITIILASIGLLFVYSATYTPEQPYSLFFKKQLLGFSCGILIYLLCTFIDYRIIMRIGFFGYVAIIGLLLFTLIKGSIGMGSQRWINLSFFKLQPSELAKILFPAFTAFYYHTHYRETKLSFVDFMPILFMMFISFLLIAKQPDLGTALIIIFSGIILLWLMEFPRLLFIGGFVTFLIAAPILWHCLKPYQKNRIMVFLGKGDSKKERYQIEQSVIAIGSGGLCGKGFLHGTQNKLRFLPESRTDFIFAVICEEWGFVGTIIILSLYLLLFMRICFALNRCTSDTVKILAIGTLMHIVLSTFINIGMVIGLLPIVGIPLPLLSYGIANLWITFASLGWLHGMIMQQHYFGDYAAKPLPV